MKYIAGAAAAVLGSTALYTVIREKELDGSTDGESDDGSKGDLPPGQYLTDDFPIV